MATHLSPLVLLLLCPLGSALVCVLKTSTSAHPSQHAGCFSEAFKLYGEIIIIKANGLCLICKPLLSKGTTSDCSSCLPFQLLPNRSFSSILLRTRAENIVSPYHMLLSSDKNETIELANDRAPYKSSLVDDLKALSAKRIHLEMLHANGSIAVQLVFSFSGDSLLQETDWFNSKSLVSAFPWNINDMKVETYNYFSLHQAVSRRDFFINVRYDEMCEDFGYLVVSQNDKCKWESRGTYRTRFLWNPNPSVQWIHGALEAAEFRLTGDFELDDGDQMYTRVC